MIVTNGDILCPILVLLSGPRLLFDLCHQIMHPHSRKNPLRGLNSRGMVVAINGIILQHLVQARVGVEVEVAAVA